MELTKQTDHQASIKHFKGQFNILTTMTQYCVLVVRGVLGTRFIECWQSAVDASRKSASTTPLELGVVLLLQMLANS